MRYEHACPEKALSAVERHFKWKLPPAYRSFVLEDELLRTELHVPRGDLAPDRLAANRDFADYLLKASKADYRLCDDDVVFLIHQGHQFWFFRCDGDDDPAVFRFREGEQRPTLVARHLSAWFATLRPAVAAADSMANYCF